jgi:fluoroacetyl-CoA thioesterase
VNLTEKIPTDLTGQETVVVTREITVAHFHPEMPEVYGTPFLIYLMEVAATNAIQRYLPPGCTSVGTVVNVRHLAATPIGRTVIATAKVESRTDRTVTFAVESHDGSELIGAGTHTRAVIDLARFNRQLEFKRTGGP